MAESEAPSPADGTGGIGGFFGFGGGSQRVGGKVMAHPVVPEPAAGQELAKARQSVGVRTVAPELTPRTAAAIDGADDSKMPRVSLHR